MPKIEGESEDKRNRRWSFYAIFKRIQQNKIFFDKVWQIQPRCMAVFGRQIEDAERVNEPFETTDQSTRELYEQFRRDIWDHGNFEPEKDKVGKLLNEFELELEAAAKPIVENTLSRQ